SGVLNLVILFFLSLGGLIGERLALFTSLRGYGINLAGSIAGVVVFTVMSFAALPPLVWILVGIAAAVPFFIRDRWALAGFAALILCMALPQARNLADHNYDFAGLSPRQSTFWSPYYRISLYELPPPAGWPHAPA